MKGSPDIIKMLNEVLRKELTGINQYFIHSKMCKNWGYEILAGVAWKESIEEMKHADQISTDSFPRRNSQSLRLR